MISNYTFLMNDIKSSIDLRVLRSVKRVKVGVHEGSPLINMGGR